jgi:hypothetical protein
LRCEGASGPDRELDVLIAQAIGFSVNGLTVDKLLGYSPHNTIEQIAIWASGDPTPFFIWRYTASLDAAMTLVPEGWVWSMNTFPNAASAYCMNPASEIVRPLRQFIATPALALCAAALRARSHLLKGHEHG